MRLIALRSHAVAWFIAAFTVFSIGRIAWIAAGGDARIVTFVPDDAFYYLMPARNFSRLGFWTFDGVSTSTGFHPLYAYFLALVYWLFPGVALGPLFVALAVFNTALVGISIWLIARSLDWYCPRPVVIASLAVALFTLLGPTTLLVESALELAVAATLFWLVFALPRAEATGARLLAAFVLGLFGSLARSDFGLLPACMVLGVALAHLHERGWRGALLRAGAGVLGAGAGVAAVFLHGYWINGRFLQASVAIKRHWSAVEGYSILAPLREFLVVPAPYMVIPVHTFALKLALLIVTAAAMLFLTWRWLDGWKIFVDPVTVFASTAIVGYAVVYGFDSGAIQIWYNTSIVIPAIALVCVFGRALRRPQPAAVYAAAAVFALAGAALSLIPPMPWQVYSYSAGLYLQAHPDLKPVGAWNAGVLGYFAGGGVVNLDGLMNDDVYPYVVDGRLADYVTRRGLRSIADHEDMLTNPLFRRRGGYAGPGLDSMLTPLATFTAPEIEPPYRLWRVTNSVGAPPSALDATAR
ncbi:MAG TPA: hypothetical protein VNE82_14750 [Candidatus Binataceae bacterium]|nr:hypothetical protein [Candidatus Binataceae bacterium]